MQVYIASYRYMLDSGESGGATLGVFRNECDAVKAIENDKQDWSKSVNANEAGWVSDFNFDDGEDWCDWNIEVKELEEE